MRITKLSLTNFKSFKETQTIEFAPITLLFGANSVGKSTVLTALFYIQQALGKEQCNPIRIDALGNKHIGGFKNLVNGKDTSKTIKIGIEYDKGDSIGASYYNLADMLPDSLGFYLESPIVSAKTVGLKFEFSWSNAKKDAYISRYSVMLDGEDVAQIVSDAEIKQPQVVAINYLHPLLKPYSQEQWLIDAFDSHNIHPNLIEDAFSAQGIELPSPHQVKDGEENVIDKHVNNGLNISEECYVSEFHELIAVTDNLININNANLFHQPLGIKSKVGATPVLGQLLETSISLDEDVKNNILREVLTDMLVAPLDNLLALLNESVCIGPLRHIPDANYTPNPYPKQTDWYDGKASWDLLQEPELWRDAQINEWLKGDDKLNLGYKIVYKTEDKETRYVEPSTELDSVEDVLAITDAIGDKLKMTLSKEDVNISPDTKQTQIDSNYVDELRKSTDFHSSLYVGQSLEKTTSMALWDCNNNIEITPSDIGVGVSQLMPLVVASLTKKKGIIACEQPELHVHPQVQVAIGDLLTQVSSDSTFLIETHSEHLVLRILRRIRETSMGTISNDLKKVATCDISVMYLEQSKDGVVASKFDVTDDGDFEVQWPGGFFDERDEELF